MSNVLVAGELLGRAAVKEERVADSPAELIHSAIVGTVLGFVAGAANGGVLLAYAPQTAATLTQGAIIVLICALGWAMYGAAIGGTGILSRVWSSR